MWDLPVLFARVDSQGIYSSPDLIQPNVFFDTGLRRDKNVQYSSHSDSLSNWYSSEYGQFIFNVLCERSDIMGTVFRYAMRKTDLTMEEPPIVLATSYNVTLDDVGNHVYRISNGHGVAQLAGSLCVWPSREDSRLYMKTELRHNIPFIPLSAQFCPVLGRACFRLGPGGIWILDYHYPAVRVIHLLPISDINLHYRSTQLPS